EENLEIGKDLLARCAAAHIILEVEIGVVGGEEDGVVGEIDEKLYTTPEDALATVAALGAGENGRYLTALTFGNVHGVYKPGNVKLRPEILKSAQEAVVAKLGLAAGSKPFDLVFHGGSGSSEADIAAAVSFGVVKMNVDTDTQYAFTRPVANHMFSNYSGVLKVDGEVGDKKVYDPRAWGKAGEAGMAARVVEACANLSSTGQTIG
ncbi:MAG: fructose-bisphosphate aldolase, partial [Marmoricola sp.]|nr:fructose-bisphosphate aldolase [Marmoricola sp.]